jgi:hypothetical protein
MAGINVTAEQLAQLMKGMAIDVREFLAHQLAPITARLGTIESKLDALERVQHDGKESSK